MRTGALFLVWGGSQLQWNPIVFVSFSSFILGSPQSVVQPVCRIVIRFCMQIRVVRLYGSNTFSATSLCHLPYICSINGWMSLGYDRSTRTNERIITTHCGNSVIVSEAWTFMGFHSFYSVQLIDDNNSRSIYPFTLNMKTLMEILWY